MLLFCAFCFKPPPEPFPGVPGEGDERDSARCDRARVATALHHILAAATLLPTMNLSTTAGIAADVC